MASVDGRHAWRRNRLRNRSAIEKGKKLYTRGDGAERTDDGHVGQFRAHRVRAAEQKSIDRSID